MAVYPLLTDVVEGPPQGQWNYEDWEQLPYDGKRYEVIDGNLYVSMYGSDPETVVHQEIVKRFYVIVGLPAEQQGLAVAYFAPIGLNIPGLAALRPDFVLVLTEHATIVNRRDIWGIPDLVAEVLSPATSEYDQGKKLTTYATGGVPEYVILDPEQRQLRLYTLKAPGEYGEPHVFNEGDTATFACLPTIGVEVSSLFAGAPDTTV